MVAPAVRVVPIADVPTAYARSGRRGEGRVGLGVARQVARRGVVAPAVRVVPIVDVGLLDVGGGSGGVDRVLLFLEVADVGMVAPAVRVVPVGDSGGGDRKRVAGTEDRIRLGVGGQVAGVAVVPPAVRVVPIGDSGGGDRGRVAGAEDRIRLGVLGQVAGVAVVPPAVSLVPVGHVARGDRVRGARREQRIGLRGRLDVRTDPGAGVAVEQHNLGVGAAERHQRVRVICGELVILCGQATESIRVVGEARPLGEARPRRRRQLETRLHRRVAVDGDADPELVVVLEDRQVDRDVRGEEAAVDIDGDFLKGDLVATGGVGVNPDLQIDGTVQRESRAIGEPAGDRKEPWSIREGRGRNEGGGDHEHGQETGHRAAPPSVAELESEAVLPAG